MTELFPFLHSICARLTPVGPKRRTLLQWFRGEKPGYDLTLPYLCQSEFKGMFSASRDIILVIPTDSNKIEVLRVIQFDLERTSVSEGVFIEKYSSIERFKRSHHCCKNTFYWLNDFLRDTIETTLKEGKLPGGH